MYNIHAAMMSDAERHTALTHLKKLNPGIVVVMDHAAWAMQLARELPNTKVIYRRYGGGDDNSHLRYTPAEWIAPYLAETPPLSGVFYYCSNEPGISQAMFNWTLECAKLTVQAGAKAVLCNVSVGVPEPQNWSMADALLRYIAQHRDRLYIGTHEYWPTLWTQEFTSRLTVRPSEWPAKIEGASHFLGRYRHLLNYCDTRGIARPYIAITEHGSDQIATVRDWQQSLEQRGECQYNGSIHCDEPQIQAWINQYALNMSPAAFHFLQVQAVWNAIYRWNKEVVGFALFCYGGVNAWDNYDYMRWPEFRTLMEGGNFKHMATNTTPQPTGLRWVVNMNVRAQPSIKAALVGSIKAGAPAQIVSTATADGYLWTEVPGGYAAYVNLKTRESYVGV